MWVNLLRALILKTRLKHGSIKKYQENDSKSVKDLNRVDENLCRQLSLPILHHRRPYHTQVREKLVKHFGKKIISLLEKKGILKIHQSMSDKDIPAEALRQVAYHGSPHKFDKFSLEHFRQVERAHRFMAGGCILLVKRQCQSGIKEII